MDYKLETCMEESIEFIYLILLRYELETIARDGKYVQTFLYKQEPKKDQIQRISCANIPVSSCTCLFCTGVEDEECGERETVQGFFWISKKGLTINGLIR